MTAARVAVVGAGAVGAKAARLLAEAELEVVVHDPDGERAAAVATSLGSLGRRCESVEEAVAGAAVALLAGPADAQPHQARAAVAAGASVVTTAPTLAAASRLLSSDAAARAAGRLIVVGAGLSPGLSCVLAAHAVSRLPAPATRIEVARSGAGGPVCASDVARSAPLHRALTAERAWAAFPDPIGPSSVRAIAAGDALLLAGLAPSIAVYGAASPRARVRRWRQRGRVEDSLGAVSVLVRAGRHDETVVYGLLDRPSTATAAVAALTARWIIDGPLEGQVGAAGLATLVTEPTDFLSALGEMGVRAAVLEAVS